MCRVIWGRVQGTGALFQIECCEEVGIILQVVSLLVSCCCCNKSPQTQRPNTTNIHHVTVLEVISPKSVSLLKGKMSSGLVPSGGSTGKSVFSPLPTSRGCLHSLACGPFFHLQSQLCNIFAPSDLQSPPHKDPWDYTGPIGTKQDTPSISDS